MTASILNHELVSPPHSTHRPKYSGKEHAESYNKYAAPATTNSNVALPAAGLTRHRDQRRRSSSILNLHPDTRFVRGSSGILSSNMLCRTLSVHTRPSRIGRRATRTRRITARTMRKMHVPAYSPCEEGVQVVA